MFQTLYPLLHFCCVIFKYVLGFLVMQYSSRLLHCILDQQSVGHQLHLHGWELILEKNIWCLLHLQESNKSLPTNHVFRCVVLCLYFRCIECNGETFYQADGYVHLAALKLAFKWHDSNSSTLGRLGFTCLQGNQHTYRYMKHFGKPSYLRVQVCCHHTLALSKNPSRTLWISDMQPWFRCVETKLLVSVRDVAEFRIPSILSSAVDDQGVQKYLEAINKIKMR